MSAREVISALVTAMSLGLAGVCAAVLLGRVDSTLAQRSVRASTTAVQRRRARRRIRGSEPTAAPDVVLVRAVATGLANQGGPVLTYLAITLISVGQTLGSSPLWLLVLAGVAAAGNLVITVVLACDYRRARHFLTTRPSLEQKARR